MVFLPHGSSEKLSLMLLLFIPQLMRIMIINDHFKGRGTQSLMYGYFLRCNEDRLIEQSSSGIVANCC